MSVLRIREANCKNCYKCVRVCPVKAIKIKGGQATVIEERCIACGSCLLACPQHAKEVISDLEYVQHLLAAGKRVYVSLAPSLAGAWPRASAGQVVTALKQLGFSEVSQTAAGAALVTKGYQRMLDLGRIKANAMLTTACPSVVSLIERYHPKLVPLLAPFVSPMIAHARLIKALEPEAKVVFIGPCLAKKAEAAREEYAGMIDGVLLYQDVADWLAEKAIDLPSLPESKFCDLDQEVASQFPTAGGMLQYLQSSAELHIADGLEQVNDLLCGMETESLKALLVECSACSGGCLNGPAMPRDESLFKRRERIRAMKKGDDQPATGTPLPTVQIRASFSPKPVSTKSCSEEAILQVLRHLGKQTPDAEFNCGACGYTTCREKAAAVLDGRAELDMCMPFMRAKAESLANLVIQSTPNAVIVVDKDLIIQDFNPAAEQMFKRQAVSVKGKEVSSLIPDDEFRAVRDGGQWVVGRKVVYPHFGLVTLQTINPIKSHDLIMGVITDITRMEHQEKEFAKVREETLEKAQQVINKQMMVAQEIAGLLGEVTADSKMLLLKLMKLVQGEGDRR